MDEMFACTTVLFKPISTNRGIWLKSVTVVKVYE